jgi:hypothetical protein
MKRIPILTLATVLTLNLTLGPPLQARMTQEPTEELSGDAPPQPTDVPVDGGLSLLLAAGAAYGAGRLRRKARSRRE